MSSSMLQYSIIKFLNSKSIKNNKQPHVMRTQLPISIFHNLYKLSIQYKEKIK